MAWRDKSLTWSHDFRCSWISRKIHFGSQEDLKQLLDETKDPAGPQTPPAPFQSSTLAYVHVSRKHISFIIATLWSALPQSQKQAAVTLTVTTRPKLIFLRISTLLSKYWFLFSTFLLLLFYLILCVHGQIWSICAKLTELIPMKPAYLASFPWREFLMFGVFFFFSFFYHIKVKEPPVFPLAFGIGPEAFWNCLRFSGRTVLKISEQRQEGWVLSNVCSYY